MFADGSEAGDLYDEEEGSVVGNNIQGNAIELSYFMIC